MRYLMSFSYDGSLFSGYQKQTNKRTVQGEVEKIISLIADEKTTIHASGRTDALVHAINQKAHFDLKRDMKKEALLKALNSLLPSDIHINNLEQVSDKFHARFDVVKKEYEYLINTGAYSVFDRNYVYQYNKELDIKAMKEAACYLIGEHDFTSFSKSDPSKETMVREIYSIEITETDIIKIKFSGNGFLRYMVRNIVGALIEVGSNKQKPDYIKDILDKKDRTKAGVTASPVGLYLKDVIY